MDQEILAKHIGDESAAEVIKLAKAYDNYVLKFKNKINKLLEPVNYEVKTGVVFCKKSKGD